MSSYGYHPVNLTSSLYITEKTLLTYGRRYLYLEPVYPDTFRNIRDGVTCIIRLLLILVLKYDIVVFNMRL